MDRNWQDREHLFHGIEHLVLLFLVGFVLLQSVYLSGSEPVEVVDGGDPFVIIPPADEFTVHSGDMVEFPWMIVNAQNRSTEVHGGVQVDWEQELDQTGDLPPGITAMAGAVERPVATTTLRSGDHRQYVHRFMAPNDPGTYRITLVAADNSHNVTETVEMQVTH